MPFKSDRQAQKHWFFQLCPEKYRQYQLNSCSATALDDLQEKEAKYEHKQIFSSRNGTADTSVSGFYLNYLRFKSEQLFVFLLNNQFNPFS